MAHTVKHVLLLKFKDSLSEAEVDELIQGYQALPSHIPEIKAFEWGTDVSVENLQQGFTHIFALTFESTEGRDAYLAHPAHVEFAGKFLNVLEKVIIIDYKPTVVNIG